MQCVIKYSRWHICNLSPLGNTVGDTFFIHNYTIREIPPVFLRSASFDRNYRYHLCLLVAGYEHVNIHPGKNSGRIMKHGR
jgi:hypothetical protein